MYRESVRGRMASAIDNNRRLFSSSKDTLVPKNRFHGNNDVKDIEKALNASAAIYNRCSTSISVHDVSQSSGYYLKSTHGNDQELSLSEVCVNDAMKNVTQLTYLQSEDPVWFVLRAFKFTSRTSSAFIRAVGHDLTRYFEHLNDNQVSKAGRSILWRNLLRFLRIQVDKNRISSTSILLPTSKQVYAPCVS